MCWVVIGHWEWGMGHGALGIGHWQLLVSCVASRLPMVLERRGGEEERGRRGEGEKI